MLIIFFVIRYFGSSLKKLYIFYTIIICFKYSDNFPDILTFLHFFYDLLELLDSSVDY